MPRIALAILYTPSIRNYAEIAVRNRETYCRRHGYDLLVADDVIDPGRPPAWSKILHVLKHLPRYDWIFWTDADALVMNLALPIERIIDERYNLIISGKYPKAPKVCSGEFLIRSCDWSLRYLRAVYDDHAKSPWWEQQSMINLLTQWRDGIKILPFGAISKRTHNYCPGDWMIHFPGMANEKRLALMRKYAVSIEPRSAP